jgi:hypothetical protein
MNTPHPFSAPPPEKGGGASRCPYARAKKKEVKGRMENVKEGITGSKLKTHAVFY